MKYEMKLKPVYFEKIKAGEKIYEVRLNDEKRQLLKIGDTLLLKKEPNLAEILQTKIVDLIYFKSFSAMLDKLPAKQIGFDNYSKNQIENIYREFYSVEDELKYGIVAIQVQIEKE